MIFSTAYLPPVSQMAAMMKAHSLLIDKHEHYIKQTYRNRALVYGPNGLLPLIIPVVQNGLHTRPIHEISISYESSWQKIHWKTITGCYRNSPYFEYFEDDLRPFYEEKTERLFDFNRMVIKKIYEILDMPFEASYSDSYLPKYDDDLRNAYHPHHQTSLESYTQVFTERHGFLSDLSILDLLCNLGMKARDYLTRL